MRIALIIFGTLDRFSGGFLYDRYLAERLVARGHTVSVISQPVGLTYAQQFRLGRSGGGDARTALQKATPNVIIVDELNHAAAMPWIANMDVPIVTLVHHLRTDETPFAPRAWFTERALLRASHAWICNSSQTLTRVRRVAGCARSSTIAFPGSDGTGYEEEAELSSGDGLPLSAADESRSDSSVPDVDARKASDLRLLFVGALIPRKNLPVLLHAIRPFPRVTLSICGDIEVDADHTRRVRRLIDRYGLGDRVTIHGRVSRQQLRSAYAAADLLTVPSHHEGFGIVYLEALREGVPVVASRSGGARDIIRDGVEGFLVNPRSAHEITVAIMAVGGDSNRLARMREAARRRAEQFHPWHRSMDGAARFIESVAGQKGVAGSE